ncbi:hypothetical protein JZ751_000404 [Albula glossodonta]|uniref:Uncharacterized protein n=1 Tax=Albula glossodonta TaxID=121402 RepID=A0A8T2PWH4_9TELE|nr:hypothetical protein JZ751_000404 [Albula glossodonta]
MYEMKRSASAVKDGCPAAHGCSSTCRPSSEAHTRPLLSVAMAPRPLAILMIVKPNSSSNGPAWRAPGTLSPTSSCRISRSGKTRRQTRGRKRRRPLQLPTRMPPSCRRPSRCTPTV